MTYMSDKNGALLISGFITSCADSGRQSKILSTEDFHDTPSPEWKCDMVKYHYVVSEIFSLALLIINMWRLCLCRYNSSLSSSLTTHSFYCRKYTHVSNPVTLKNSKWHLLSRKTDALLFLYV